MRPDALGTSDGTILPNWRITLGGDVMLDTRIRPPRVLSVVYGTAAVGNKFSPDWLEYMPNSRQTIEWLTRRGISTAGAQETAHVSSSIAVDCTSDPFGHVKNLFKDSALSVINLECCLTHRGRSTRNEMAYRADPRWAALLRDAGITTANLANNHCLDYGEVGLLDTLASLDEADIGVVGVGRNVRAARAPQVYERDRISVGLLGYCGIGPDTFFATEDESGSAPLNQRDIIDDVERIRLDVDVLLVQLHWGREGMRRPSEMARTVARAIIDAGADAIVGHHSHMVGPIDVYRAKPIIYSLGNLCFGHTHNPWELGMLVQLHFLGPSLQESSVIPLDIRGNRSWCPMPLKEPEARGFLQNLAAISDGWALPPDSNDRRISCVSRPQKPNGTR